MKFDLNHSTRFVDNISERKNIEKIYLIENNSRKKAFCGISLHSYASRTTYMIKNVVVKIAFVVRIHF